MPILIRKDTLNANQFFDLKQWQNNFNKICLFTFQFLIFEIFTCSLRSFQKNMHPKCLITFLYISEYIVFSDVTYKTLFHIYMYIYTHIYIYIRLKRLSLPPNAVFFDSILFPIIQLQITNFLYDLQFMTY